MRELKSTSLVDSSLQKGKVAELFAQSYYQKRGYAWIASNHRINGIEIDLIMYKGHYFLIEIKTLRKANEIHFRLSQKQIKRLLRAREIFQNSKNELVELRVLYVLPEGKTLDLGIEDHF